MATVITMPKRAWIAVARAIVFDRTLVAEHSQRITKHTGPMDTSYIPFQITFQEISSHLYATALEELTIIVD